MSPGLNGSNNYWLNDEKNYGLVTVVLHWLTAITVVGMFSLGKYMVDLEYNEPWYHKGPELHKATGVLLLILHLFRIVWHSVSRVPAIDKNLPRWQQQVAYIVHKMLYLLILLSVASGYLIATGEGKGISVFGLFTTPVIGPFEDFFGGKQADVAGEWHEFLTYLLIAVVSLHLLAALKHHFIDKDNTFRKMVVLSKDTLKR